MKFPIKFVIAVVALLIGISGVLVCLLPHYGAEKVVYTYIKAAEDGNMEKMYRCTVLSELSGSLNSSQLQGLMGQSAGTALVQNVISLPSDAVNVESVKIMGCTREEIEGSAGAGYNVTALIKAVYTDEAGEEHETVVDETFRIVKSGNSYKIYG